MTRLALTGTVLLSIGLLWAGCTSSDSGGGVVGDVAADVGQSVEEDTYVAPECDPVADPTGCEEGAYCWFAFCAPLTSGQMSVAPVTSVGDVELLALPKGGRALAFHTWTVTEGEGDVADSREDAIYFAFVGSDGVQDAPTLVDRWTFADDDLMEPGPRLRLLADPTGSVAIVRGPNPIIAYFATEEGWEASVPRQTGSAVHLGEGTIGAAFDAEGALHVAYREGTVGTLDVATLSRADAGEWRVVGVSDVRDDWGSVIAGATVGGRAVFAYIDESVYQPSKVRGPLIISQTDAGWAEDRPSLSEKITITGRIMGFDAAVAPNGDLSLAWLSRGRQLGLAVRQPGGSWKTDEDTHRSALELSDDVRANLSLGWWRGAAVMAWIGSPERECGGEECFDVRMAVARCDDDQTSCEWQEERLGDLIRTERVGELDLGIDGTGGAALLLGGGPFTDFQVPDPTLYLKQLPNWSRASE